MVDPSGILHTVNKKEDSFKTVLFLKPIYFKNISIMVPPTTTKAKATKIYRQITMTINFKTRYM